MKAKKVDRGGRRFGTPKKVIGYRVPVCVSEKVKEAVRPMVEAAVKKEMKLKNANI